MKKHIENLVKPPPLVLNNTNLKLLDIDDVNPIASISAATNNLITILSDHTAPLICLKCCTELADIQKSIFLINENLQELNSKFNNLGVAGTSVTNNASSEELLKFLPIKNKEAFQELETFLESEENKQTFYNYFAKIGGNGYKDNISRILKKLYTNEFARSCSRLGQRGNFRLVGSKSVMNVKDIILKSHGVQEEDIEITIAEWVRHAAQRLKREAAN